MKKIDKRSVFYGGKFSSQYVNLPGWGKIDIVKTSGGNGLNLLISRGDCSCSYFLRGIWNSIISEQLFVKIKRKDNGILFILDDSIYFREDMKKMESEVAKAAGDAGFMEITQHMRYKYKRKYPLLIILNRIRKALLFASKILKLQGTYSDKLVFLYTMLWCDELFPKLCNKINNSVNLVVFCGDAAFVPGIVCEFCKLKGIKTATLQHAPAMAYRESEAYLCQGGMYSCSLSDYFLTWSTFTANEALKAGMKQSKIKILGNPYCVGKSYIQSGQRKHNLFGVALSNISGGFELTNSKVIQIANEFSEKYQLHYVIRFHPGQVGLQEELTNDYYVKDLKISEMSVSDYVNSVDFTLNVSAGLYTQLLFYKHKVYRYSTYDIEDVYRDIKWNTFSNCDTLENLVKNDIDLTQEQREYLLGSEDVESNYKNFFARFIN